MVPCYLKKGYMLFCLDEATFCIQPKTARGWYLKNKQPVQLFAYVRAHFHCYGAHGYDRFHYMFSDKLQWPYFLRFIKRLHKRYPKLFLVLDNSGWHTAKAVESYFEENKETIHIEFLPPYSPELMPTEQVWKNLKQSTANKFLHNKQELKNHVNREAKKKKNLVKTFGYLCP